MPASNFIFNVMLSKLIKAEQCKPLNVMLPMIDLLYRTVLHTLYFQNCYLSH